MQEVVSPAIPSVTKRSSRVSRFASRVQAESPSLTECAIAIGSATLFVVSFPDFDLWPLAWFGLVPLLIAIAVKPQGLRCFLLAWLFGAVFFYGSCYWLTYSMIHFGAVPRVLAYIVLAPGAVLLGIFPALCGLAVARVLKKWGLAAIFLSPLFWTALEWLRLETTGQLWNALGYSQAYQPMLIQAARWGGVYAVSFMIVLVNAAIAFAVLKRSRKALVVSGGVVLVVVLLVLGLNRARTPTVAGEPATIVVAIQPNVPMDLQKSTADLRSLTTRHFEMSLAALSQLQNNSTPRLVIWPESPMNFTYGTNAALREMLAAFARSNNTSVLLNSQEVAPNDGVYNSAVLINEQGSLVAQYDKIRLLPFGEYVPLPQWLPGAGLIRAIVGDFTPGKSYQVMSFCDARVGVFICIESAYPDIARKFSDEGSDVLINISNDGYLGPTAVMRQHLSNAIFRAVENGRPVLRVTNSGISALITSTGEVKDATESFRPAVRTWPIARAATGLTFYAKHGDWFVISCTIFSFLVFVLTFRRQAIK